MIEPIEYDSNQATLRGLLPGWTYTVEASANGGKTWGRALRFETTADDTPPASVSNLQVSVTGSSFVLTWDAPTTDAKGEPLSDFNDYIIRVYPTGEPDSAIAETTKSNTYEFSIYQNRHFFGTPRGALTFEVIARDLTLNLSEPVVVDAASTAPVEFTIGINTGPRAIEVFWDNQGVTTFYKVYRGTIAGFAPNDSTNMVGTIVTEAGDGLRISYWDIPPTTDTYYYKVVAVDAFNNTAQSSNEVSGEADEAGGSLDTTRLNAPAAPTVGDGVHSFTVSHNMLDTGGVPLGSNLVRFDVYADTVADFTPIQDNFVGSMAASAGSVAEETFVWVVRSTTTNAGTTVSGTDTVYVKVIAVNIAGGASDPSPASAPATVEGAGAQYFKALAIGDGHINDLSANKLKANTAIIRNLNVNALLKMGGGGIIESGNYTVDTSGVQTAGWRLTDTQFSIVGATRINGSIEATAGWLQNLTVYGNLTVGSSTAAGTIQSSNYIAGSQGWKISNQGAAELSGATIRGYVDAQSGYLRSLNVIGTLAIGSGGKLSVNNDRVRIDQYGFTAYNGSTNTVRIDQYGNATFSGSLSAASGTFQGDITAGATMTSANVTATTIEGGVFRTAPPGYERMQLRNLYKDRLEAYNADGSMAYFRGGTSGGMEVSGSLRLQGWTSNGILYARNVYIGTSYENRALHTGNHSHSTGTVYTGGSSQSNTSPNNYYTSTHDYGYSGYYYGTRRTYGQIGSAPSHYHELYDHRHSIGGHRHTLGSHQHGMGHVHTITI